MNHAVQDIMRAQGVKRWNIVETARPQSLAEHSFNVAMIAREIMERMGFSTLRGYAIIRDALEHDLNEIYYGDSPTPGKYRNDNEIPWSPPRSLEEMIIKLADLIESTWFIQMFGIGGHAADVLGRMEHSTEKYGDMLSMNVDSLPIPDELILAAVAAADSVRSDLYHGDFGRLAPEDRDVQG